MSKAVSRHFDDCLTTGSSRSPTNKKLLSQVFTEGYQARTSKKSDWRGDIALNKLSGIVIFRQLYVSDGHVSPMVRVTALCERRHIFLVGFCESMPSNKWRVSQ